MYHKHHTRGIVISNNIEGVDSKRLLLFTEKFGLINARAQGVRNLKSKLRSGTQTLSFGEFSLVHGKIGWKLVSVRPERNFFEDSKDDLDRLNIINNVLKLIKKLIDEQSLPNLFKITINFFVYLDNAPREKYALAECLTLMRILHELGLMRHDPEFTIPLVSSEINTRDLENLAPKRCKIISLINESLKIL